ncbi:MAG: hypothetical protein U1E28_18495 [Beijerinckiaceae bacterium]
MNAKISARELGLTQAEVWLMAFETACPQPTTAQIDAWCDKFPEFAAEIREHAKFVEPPIARGRAAMELLSEAEIASAQAEALEIMRKATAERVSSDPAKKRKSSGRALKK